MSISVFQIESGSNLKCSRSAWKTTYPHIPPKISKGLPFYDSELT